MLAAQPLKGKRLLSAATPPGSEEVFLMIDTCAGASVFPKNFDKRAIKDDTVPKMTLRTATNAPVKMTGGKRSTYALRNGSSVSVKYNEANVCFPIASVAEATLQGNWFVFGPGGQAMAKPELGRSLSGSWQARGL